MPDIILTADTDIEVINYCRHCMAENLQYKKGFQIAPEAF